MRSLQIICAGGHGKVVAEVAELCGYDRIVFIDSKWPEREINGRWQIVSDRLLEDGSDIFCGAGNNALRQQLFEKHGIFRSPVLIHPAAVVSSSAIIGAGTLIMPGVVVNADTKIGKGVILNTGCSVDHDCTLGDFVHVSPGARLAGTVAVGSGTWIGIGAAIIENVTLGKGVLVAAGAAVVSPVADNLRVGGVPARTLSK